VARRLIPAGCAVVGRASRGGEDDLACGLLSLAGCSFVGRSSRGSGEEAPSSSVALGTRTEGGVSCSEVPGNCRQASAIRAADRASIVIAKRSSPRFPSPTTQLSVCRVQGRSFSDTFVFMLERQQKILWYPSLRLKMKLLAFSSKVKFTGCTRKKTDTRGVASAGRD